MARGDRVCAAYLWWGFAPFYFKMLAAVPPTVILGHRVVWSVLLLVVMIGIGGQWGAVREVARNARVRL